MSRGSLMQMVSYGAQDVYLTGRAYNFALYPQNMQPSGLEQSSNDPRARGPSGTFNYSRLNQIGVTFTMTNNNGTNNNIHRILNNINQMAIKTLSEKPMNLVDNICLFSMAEIEPGTKVDYCGNCRHICDSEQMDIWCQNHSICPLCRVEIIERSQFIYS